MTEKIDEDESKSTKDIFRDTPLRYLGYTNEIGEAFRQQIHVKFVHLTYLVASSYCLSDASSKAYQVLQQHDHNATVTKKSANHRALEMFIEAAVWQGLASVIIPGFAINRICWLSSHVLSRSSFISAARQKWVTSAIGLGAIPLIIKPIDSLVDQMMEASGADDGG